MSTMTEIARIATENGWTAQNDTAKWQEWTRGGRVVSVTYSDSGNVLYAGYARNERNGWPMTYECANGTAEVFVHLGRADSGKRAAVIRWLTGDLEPSDVGAGDEAYTELGNQTSFADHYRAASDLFMAALADAEGETFALAFAEALRASDAASGETETEIAQTLARTIRDTAPEYGVRLNSREARAMVDTRSRFARDFASATTRLLQAMESPSADKWAMARDAAARALDNGADVERVAADHLQCLIAETARGYGYEI